MLSVDNIQVVKFLFNGGLATGVHFSLFAVCIHFTDQYALSYMVGAVFGTSFTYFGSKYFVFKPRKPDNLRVLKFIIAYTFIPLFFACLGQGISHYIQVNKQFLAIVLLAFQALVMYVVSKHAVFGK